MAGSQAWSCNEIHSEASLSLPFSLPSLNYIFHFPLLLQILWKQEYSLSSHTTKALEIPLDRSISHQILAITFAVRTRDGVAFSGRALLYVASTKLADTDSFSQAQAQARVIRSFSSTYCLFHMPCFCYFYSACLLLTAVKKLLFFFFFPEDSIFAGWTNKAYCTYLSLTQYTSPIYERFSIPGPKFCYYQYWKVSSFAQWNPHLIVFGGKLIQD